MQRDRSRCGGRVWVKIPPCNTRWRGVKQKCERAREKVSRRSTSSLIQIKWWRPPGEAEWWTEKRVEWYVKRGGRTPGPPKQTGTTAGFLFLFASFLTIFNFPLHINLPVSFFPPPSLPSPSSTHNLLFQFLLIPSHSFVIYFWNLAQINTVKKF